MAGQEQRERTFSEAEIKARLERELPHWWYESGWIRRKYKTHSWKGTLMAARAAHSKGRRPRITASPISSTTSLRDPGQASHRVTPP